MNVVRAFAEYLQGIGVATLGQDLFISRAPSSNNVPPRIFWVKAAGGTSLPRMVNGSSQKTSVIELNHRDVRTEGVYDTLQSLGDDLTCAGCLTLEGYQVTDVSVEGPWTDQDLDDEERDVGLLQITITIYKEC